MKKTIHTSLLAILSLFIFLPTFAQQEKKRPPRMRCLTDPVKLFAGYWDDVILQPCDTTFLEAKYDLKYRITTTTGNYYEMITVLQIGNFKQKYYSLIRQFTDDVQQDVTSQIKKLPIAPGIGASHKYTEEENQIKETAGIDLLNSEIWVDALTRQITERAHDYSKYNCSIEYVEPCPQFEWQFTEQTDTVCGYNCFVAATTFRGRTWNVWYTAEIPVSAGPWKFSGLPGLILRAQDTQKDYIWNCRIITQKSVPIVYYKGKQILLNREKWRKRERLIHEAPLEMLGENGMCEFYIHSKLVTPEDNWSIPYNPIERE